MDSIEIARKDRAILTAAASPVVSLSVQAIELLRAFVQRGGPVTSASYLSRVIFCDGIRVPQRPVRLLRARRC